MSGLPDMSQEALKNYFLYALPPGGFLTSLLSGGSWTDVIARAEFLLEDLARGAELAEITKNTNLTGVFRIAAEEYLQNKLVVKEKEPEEA